MSAQRIKFAMFALLAMGLSVGALELIAGLVVGDCYIHLAGIMPQTASRSYGYFVPNQRRTLLFMGLPPYRVTIDALGLRLTKPIAPEKAPGAQRILCVGDSTTFGLYINDDASYPFQLQQRLDARMPGQYEVLNAGVGGLSIDDERDYLQRAGLRLNPDLVILMFCANDLRELREQLKPFYERIQEDFDDRGAERMVRALKDTRLYRLFFMGEVAFKHWRYVHKKIRDPEVRRIYVSRSRALEDVRLIGQYNAEQLVREPQHPQVRADWAAYLQELERVRQLLDGRGIRLLLAISPEVPEVFGDEPTRYAAPFIAYAKQHDLSVIDVNALMRSVPLEGRLALFHAPPRDFHLSGQGNARVADAIASWLETQVKPPVASR